MSIKRECEAAVGQPDNVVVNAPHTAVEIAGEWPHPYTCLLYTSTARSGL